MAKESKKRGESAEIYTENGRGELAAKERAEAQIIDEYLPTPLTDAELVDVVDTALAQVSEELGERPGMRQMGQVIKAASALAKGKADGARISAAVEVPPVEAPPETENGRELRVSRDRGRSCFRAVSSAGSPQAVRVRLPAESHPGESRPVPELLELPGMRGAAGALTEPSLM